MVIGKEDRRIIGIGARNSQEHDSNGREDEIDGRIKEDHENTVLIRHRSTMTMESSRGMLVQGINSALVEIQRRLEADQEGGMLRSKAEIWVPCRGCLLGLEKKSGRRTYTMPVCWLQ